MIPLRGRLREIAFEALEGVGDATLGEWEEWTGHAFHVRRRLSADEAERVGPVLDVRGTEEARRRFGRMPSALRPLVPADVLADEVGPS